MKTEDVNFLEENLTRINKALFKTLPEKDISRITEAIHYSVMNGGKRIRPQIILLLCEMLEVEIKNDNIDLIADAGELIHCYSLIKDDLPSQDSAQVKQEQYKTENLQTSRANVVNQSGNKRTARIGALSYNWDNSEAPKKYIKFTTIRLNPGEGRDWLNRMRNDAKLKISKGFTGIRGVFWLVSGGQFEMHVVEPYDSHGMATGTYSEEDFDYMDEYNEMFGWRSLPWDSMKADMAIRDYGGEIIETLEFIPEMSTSVE